MPTPPSMPLRQPRGRATTRKTWPLSSPSKGKGKARGRSPRKSGRLALKKRVHVAKDGRRYYEDLDGDTVFLDKDGPPPPYTSGSMLPLEFDMDESDVDDDGSDVESDACSNAVSFKICEAVDMFVEDSQQPEDLLVMPTALQAPPFEESQDPGMMADCEESYVNANNIDEDSQENENCAGPSGSGDLDKAAAAASKDDHDAHLIAVSFLTDADLENFSPHQNTKEIIHRMRLHAAWSAQMQARMAELKSKLSEEVTHRQMSRWDSDELKAKLAAAEETIARIAAAMGPTA